MNNEVIKYIGARLGVDMTDESIAVLTDDRRYKKYLKEMQGLASEEKPETLVEKVAAFLKAHCAHEIMAEDEPAVQKMAQKITDRLTSGHLEL